MTDYVELHAHSYYSLLDGASSPEALVARAAALGMPALALTDHDAVYGAVPFVEAARQAGIKPILGAEVTLEGGAHLTLLAADETGWGNLCRLISLGRGNAPKGEAALPLEALEGHTGGLIALSGCRHGVIASALLKGDRRTAMTAARHYQRLFGPDGFWIEMQHHLHPQDDRLNAALAQFAERLGLGLVATNNVHYATPDEHRLQDVLVSIRHLTPLHQAGNLAAAQLRVLSQVRGGNGGAVWSLPGSRRQYPAHRRPVHLRAALWPARPASVSRSGRNGCHGLSVPVV